LIFGPLCGEKQAGRRLTFGFAGVYRRGQTGWAMVPAHWGFSERLFLDERPSQRRV
jgi:hypothetical protein